MKPHKDFVATDKVKCTCHTCDHITYLGFFELGKCKKHNKGLSQLGIDRYRKFNCDQWKPFKKKK